MSDQEVTGETILEGFRSLAEAMATGFDALRAEFSAKLSGELSSVRGDIRDLRAEMNQRFGDLESRMMRRFDEVGVRLDDHERRITVVETQS